MNSVKDKVVLVTGAAGAIGSAVVEAVAQSGGIAVTSDLPGRRDVHHALDVTSEEDWTRTIAAIEQDVGRLDGLVNAAGIVALGTVEDTDYATWRRVMAINLDDPGFQELCKLLQEADCWVKISGANRI